MKKIRYVDRIKHGLYMFEVHRNSMWKRLQLASSILKDGSSWVVIYDQKTEEGEFREEWYGYFDSRDEAVKMFTDAFGADETVGNARFAICTMGTVPGIQEMETY